jgi:hypothetical protein
MGSLSMSENNMTDDELRMDLHSASTKERIEKALAESPALYVNSFVNMVGSADIVTVFERNGAPIAVINMSYTTAKSYAILLGRIVADLEAKTGREIMTTEVVDSAMKARESTIQ